MMLSDGKMYNKFFIMGSNALKSNFTIYIKSSIFPGVGGPRGVMIKALDCGIVVSNFEDQLHY